jgi:hypothetical protein
MVSAARPKGGMMGRPTVITDTVREAIEYLYRPGVSVRALHVELTSAGVTVSQATVARYLRTRAKADGAVGAAAVARTPAPSAGPVDEIAGLEAELVAVDAALAVARPLLTGGGKGILDYQRLTAIKESLARTLAEIRPRPEAEAQRLAGLGAAAKAELLERARAAARMDEDLRGRVQRQAELLRNMADRMADA